MLTTAQADWDTRKAARPTEENLPRRQNGLYPAAVLPVSNEPNS